MIVHGYNEHGLISATINGEEVLVPNDPDNRHRTIIAEWEALGNTIPPYVKPPQPLQPLDRLEFWLAAAEIGVTKQSVINHAQAAYAADPIALAKAMAFIEEAQRYRREDPILIAMAAAEGITEAHLDALWGWASSAA